MNYKMLIFAGAVTMAIGIGLGMVLSRLAPTPYQGGWYREQSPGYIIIGGATGFLIGVSQEAIRQLKQKQEEK